MKNQALLTLGLVAGSVAAIGIPLENSYGQLTPPPISVTGNTTQAVSTAEAIHHIRIKEYQVQSAHSFRSAGYPLDSMHKVVTSSAQQWLGKVKSNSVSGIHIDPLVGIGIAAGQSDYARLQIAARLASANLSFSDKAYTYMNAVEEFSDPYYPERLAAAEFYLKQLDAMGDSAAYWQFQARRDLVDTYYSLGRTKDVLRHGLRAMELMKALHYYDRGLMFPYLGGDGELYSATMDALSSDQRNKPKIEALNKMLMDVIVPPPALVAQDSGHLGRGKLYERALKQMILGNSKVGMVAKPIVSNYWLNRPTPDSAEVAVNDGKIHILELGHYTCPPCLSGLQGLQRLKTRFPGIEVMLATSTLGAWGNRLVPPEEEAGHLADYFLNNQKLTFPIAIWKASKVLNEDGGLTPDSYGPAFESYPSLAKPTIWIVDANGIVRRVILGFDRDKEEQMAKTITFLEKEASVNAAN